MGRELGLWWTESQRYNPGRDAMTLFSRQKQAHVKSAFKELDLAVRAGATMVGLDTFHDYATPAWEHYFWLRDMQERFPKVTFITEPIACDVVHTLSPTFQQHWAWVQPPQKAEDVYPITTPHFLADFLLPGHEIWGAMRYVGLSAVLWAAPDDGQDPAGHGRDRGDGVRARVRRGDRSEQLGALSMRPSRGR
ncbi:MAG: hypothetical protein V9F04_01190 [Dermatophilaceae bacterium]